MSALDPDLYEVFEHLSREPYFCGFRLAHLREQKNQDPQQQADELGIALPRLVFLALSRMPQGRSDLDALAWQLDMKADKLADVLGEPSGK